MRVSEYICMRVSEYNCMHAFCKLEPAPSKMKPNSEQRDRITSAILK